MCNFFKVVYSLQWTWPPVNKPLFINHSNITMKVMLLIVQLLIERDDYMLLSCFMCIFDSVQWTNTSEP